MRVMEHGWNDAKKGALLARKRLDTTRISPQVENLGPSFCVRTQISGAISAFIGEWGLHCPRSCCLFAAGVGWGSSVRLCDVHGMKKEDCRTLT